MIFDPHGDYTGLADVSSLKDRVRRYYAKFPLFEEDSETAAEIVNSLGYELSETMRTRFDDVFRAAQNFIAGDSAEVGQRADWLAKTLNRKEISLYGIKPDMWLVAQLAEAGELALRQKNDFIKRPLADWGWLGLEKYSQTDVRTLEGIKKRAYRAAAARTQRRADR